MKDKGDSILSLFGLMGAVLVLWLFSWYTLKGIPSDERGTFGDMFGAVNALFSGLAFSGIIYTIIIQKKELGLQREELALQRDEIKKSTEELAGQKEQMQIQRFEHTFFNLLSQHTELTSALNLGESSGKAVFSKLHRSLSESYHSRSSNISETESMKRILESFHHILPHYCKNVKTIVEFVESQKEIPDNDKETYISFFKAQLSSFELVLIYYYFFNNQFDLLLFKKYEFFRELNKSLLLDQNRENSLYDLQ